MSEDFSEIALDEFLPELNSTGHTGSAEEVSLHEFLVDLEDTPRDAGIIADETPDSAAELKKRIPEISPARLKEQIAAFYLNEHLLEALLKHGSIPQTPAESVIGVGFVDIVDYSYLASWLSPRENQMFLNGLYTAFHHVLKKHNGFLNKISGDSLMFHIGGNIDPAVREMKREEMITYIAKTLLDTCVDIQRTCRLFNDANREFLSGYDDEESRRAVKQAFTIISTLRENLAMVSGINAMFQVKVRIGASMGEVCIGNFGPPGASQWDVIGEPVIVARRMESTAPVDGLRISQSVFEALNAAGLVEQYHNEFIKEARAGMGSFSELTREELFFSKNVILQDKKNAKFESYAVQTNPFLPEDIRDQVSSYLEMDEDGADRVIELLKYYRGNRLVTAGLDELFCTRGVNLRKAVLYKKLQQKKYEEVLESVQGKIKEADRLIERKLSLFSLFKILNRYQDAIHEETATLESLPFNDFSEYTGLVDSALHKIHTRLRMSREQYFYFNDILFPLVFTHLRACLLEYQARKKESIPTAC
jgi:class 3 adenylate cyclase